MALPGKLVTQERSIAAAAQFGGTEFSVASPNPNGSLKLLELDLEMGTESKTWRVVKTNSAGTVIALIQQSTDSMGAPAANTDESVVLIGPDVELLLERGDQIQIITTGATAAMVAKVYFEEVIFA